MALLIVTYDIYMGRIYEKSRAFYNKSMKLGVMTRLVINTIFKGLCHARKHFEGRQFEFQNGDLM